MKHFGISQIRPVHRHKPAGTTFCGGESMVRSYSSPVLNHACTLRWLSSARLRMLSTSQPSVQPSDSRLLCAASSPILLYWGRLVFVFFLLSVFVHMGHIWAGSLALSAGVKGGDCSSPAEQLHHDCGGVSWGRSYTLAMLPPNTTCTRIS